jgi:hypothetical protein
MAVWIGFAAGCGAVDQGDAGSDGAIGDSSVVADAAGRDSSGRDSATRDSSSTVDAALPPGDASAQLDLAVPPPNAILVGINANDVHQTVYGWGGGPSDFSLNGGIPVTQSQIDRANDILFKQVQITTGDLKSSVLESTGGWNGKGNDNADPFTFNWAGFDGTAVDTLKKNELDVGAPLGFTDYILKENVSTHWYMSWLAPNSGLPGSRSTDFYQRCCTDGYGTSCNGTACVANAGCNSMPYTTCAWTGKYLDEGCEAVAAGFHHWKNTYGTDPPWIDQLMNEPTTGNVEITGGDYNDLRAITKHCAQRLMAEGFKNPQFVLPNEERVDASLNSAMAMFQDPDVGQWIGAIGYHCYPYGSTYANIQNILNGPANGMPSQPDIDSRNKLRDFAKSVGKPTWMTEVCCGNADERTFDAVRARVVHVRDEMEYADAAAWVLYSWGRTTSASPGWVGDDIVVIDNDNGNDSVVIGNVGYALGHYTRWIKRGAIRIADTSSDPMVMPIAFRDLKLGKLVIVVVNNAMSTGSVTVNLTGVQVTGSVTGEQSTEKAGYWQPVPRSIRWPRIASTSICHRGA